MADQTTAQSPSTVINLGSIDPSSMFDRVESAMNNANWQAKVNSARSALEADALREWQEKQNAKAMQFNANEAAKNRDWQEYMSNTAHQREIADLKAAGLNPVLSAMGGNGAAVTSGATAQGVTSAGAKGEVDTSANQAISNMLGSMVNYMSNMTSQTMSALTNMATTDRMAQVNEMIGHLQYAGTLYSADSAKMSNAIGHMLSGMWNYNASKYSADKSFESNKYSQDSQNYRQHMEQMFHWFNRLFFPSNAYEGAWSTTRDKWWYDRMNDAYKQMFGG